MKARKPNPQHVLLRQTNSRRALTLVLATLCCAATLRAAEGDTAPPVAAPSADNPDKPTATTVQKTAPPQPSAQALSPVVIAVVKMADADVSPAVIKTYIECSPSAAPLTDADIIPLKQHKVGDEIVTALIKQGAQARALEVQRKHEAVARTLAARNASSGGMDPNSYEYFQYYYLQPRALASAYQRLSPYYAPWGAPYGSWPGFGPRPHGYGQLRY